MNELTGRDDLRQLDISSLLSRAKSDPEHVLGAAAALLSGSSSGALADEEVARMQWAKGVALFEMGRNAEAAGVLEVAVQSPHRAVRYRAAVSLASVEAAAGKMRQAVERLQGLMQESDPIVRALAGSQLGVVQLQRGKLHESLELLQDALPALRESPAEQPSVARVLINIGTCFLLLGNVAAARPPLEEAVNISQTSGQKLVLAAGLQNLGYAEARLGQADRAVELMELARGVYAEMGDGTRRNLATLFEDLSETYRFAGLGREALRYARLAAWAVREGGDIEKQTDAELQRARCLLEAGEPEAALACVSRARSAYEASDRPLQVRRADALILEATSLGVAISADAAAQAALAATELESAGWVAEGIAMRIRMAELLVADGQAEPAEHLLSLIPAPIEPVPLLEQLERSYAEALACHLRSEVLEAPIASAVDQLTQVRDLVEDPELRLAAARIATRLRGLELAHAVAQNDALAAFNSEAKWRRLSRLRQSTVPVEEVHPVEPRALVQWGASGQHLYRIESGPKSTVAACGSWDDVVECCRLIRHRLARLTRSALPDATSSAVAQALLESCRELGDMLGVGQGKAPFVLAPEGELVELPWRLIAPGAVIHEPWTGIASTAPAAVINPNRAALIAGPGLEHSDEDIVAFRATFPDGRIVRGAEATMATLRELMESSSLLHIAAHGKFRSDSPRHSHVEMVDGPARLHHLDQMRRAPAVVVLGVCDAARGEVRSGGIRRGVPASLLDLGSHTVVAPICPVADLEFASLMVDFYRTLQKGSIDDALRAMAPQSIGEEPRRWATAHAVQSVTASSTPASIAPERT